MSNITRNWPPNRSAEREPGARRRRFRLASILLGIIGGLVVLVGSFGLTLYVMEYIDVWKQQEREAATAEVRPTTWQTSGEASYEIRNDSVAFSGPDYIYNEVACGSLDSKIRFSIFVEHAGRANLQLQFISKENGPIGEPVVTDIEGIRNQAVEIRADTRRGAGLIRAIIYSPEHISEVVVFNNPFIECKPV